MNSGSSDCTELIWSLASPSAQKFPSL